MSMRMHVLFMLLVGSSASRSVSARNGSTIYDMKLRGRQAVSKTQKDNPPSVAVLLTMYNSPTREAMYASRLRWWLGKTDLPIFVVDSANRSFPKEIKAIRPFQELHFDQKEFLPSFWTQDVDGATTMAELASLDHAWKKFGKLWSTKYDYVIKVTAKYALPGLESALHSLHRGHTFIFQSDDFNLNNESPWKGMPWISTECIGFNSHQMGDLLQLLTDRPEPYLETKVAAAAKHDGFSYEKLPPLQIPKEFRTARAAGDVLTSVLQVSA